MARLHSFLLLAALALCESQLSDITVILVAEVEVDAGAADASAGSMVLNNSLNTGICRRYGYLGFHGMAKCLPAEAPLEGGGGLIASIHLE